MVGSSSGIVAAARRRLGRAAGAPTQVAANLGIDDRGGSGRASSGKATKLEGRFAKARAIMANMRRLRRQVGVRIRSLFICGLLPSNGYGAAVNGLSPSELKRLRVLAGKFVRPWSAGRSLTIALAIGDDRAKDRLSPRCSSVQKKFGKRRSTRSARGPGTFCSPSCATSGKKAWSSPFRPGGEQKAPSRFSASFWKGWDGSGTALWYKNRFGTPGFFHGELPGLGQAAPQGVLPQE